MRKETMNQLGVISLKTVAIIVVILLIIVTSVGVFIFFNPIAPCDCGDVERTELQAPRRTWWRGTDNTFIEFHHGPDTELPSPELRWRVAIRNPPPHTAENPPREDFWAETLAGIQAIAKRESDLGNPSGDANLKLIECIAGFTSDKSILGEQSTAEFRRATCE